MNKSFETNGIEYSVSKNGSSWVVQAVRKSNGGKTILKRCYDESEAQNHLKVLRESHNKKAATLTHKFQHRSENDA